MGFLKKRETTMLIYFIMSISLFIASIGPINTMNLSEDNNEPLQTSEERHPELYAIINKLDHATLQIITKNQITRVQKMDESVEDFIHFVQESYNSAINNELINTEEETFINALLINCETECDYTEESISSLANCSELFKKFNAMEQWLIYAENCLAVIMKILKTTHTGTDIIMSHITNTTQRIQQLTQLEEPLKERVYNLLTRNITTHSASILHRAYHKITAVEELLSKRLKIETPAQPEPKLDSEESQDNNANQQQELATLLVRELSLLNSINNLICIEDLFLRNSNKGLSTLSIKNTSSY